MRRPLANVSSRSRPSTPQPGDEPAAADRPTKLWNPAALKRFVRRLGQSSADCEDIVQEAYLRLLESSGRGRTVRSQLGYLTVIARNLVTDAARRDSQTSKQNLALRVLSTQLNPSEPSPEELAFVEQSHERLARALRALPSRPRKVFLLHRLRALRQTEIAQRLGITTRTVERDLAFALAHLKDALFGGDSP